MRISDWSSDVCSSDLVEHDIGLRLGEPQRDVAVHVDPRNLVAARFERVGDAIAAHQRHLALGRPAAHQDGDMPGAAGHNSTPIIKTVCPELVEGLIFLVDVKRKGRPPSTALQAIRTGFDKPRATGERKSDIITRTEEHTFE